MYVDVCIYVMHFQRKMLFMRNRKYLCRHALIFYKQMVIKGVKECVISVNICTFSFFNIDETKSKIKDNLACDKNADMIFQAQ